MPGVAPQNREHRTRKLTTKNCKTMKIHHIIIPVLASAMLMSSCDDQIMEWGKPAGEGEVTSADIPLAVKEALANYEPVKSYASQYLSLIHI